MARPARILSPRGTVLFESRTNQLFVSDIPTKLEEVSMMISKIDIPVRQVLIEARIVEADDKFGRALASSWVHPTCVGCAAAHQGLWCPAGTTV